MIHAAHQLLKYFIGQFDLVEDASGHSEEGSNGRMPLRPLL
jgi:hypothetical protein